MSERDAEYLLGAEAAELERLRLQHELWRGPMLDLLDAAGFGPGDALLDLGCGPGWSTLELAARVGPRGRVLGRDRSPVMIEAGRRLAAAERAFGVEFEQGDAADPAPTAAWDGAYARWLFCWLPEPMPALRAAARALRPGGRLAISDYLCYAPELRLEPSTPAFARGIAAVEASWRAAGGDPQIGARLPGMLQAAGLHVLRMDVVRRVAAAGDPLWRWPQSFFPLFVPKLVAAGQLDAAAAQAFLDEWRRAAEDPRARFVAPPMLQLVAERPVC